MNFTDLLDKLRAFSANQRQQGDGFEQLMVAYLQTDPAYSNRFDKVYRLMDWPDRPDGLIDDGIDLVGIERYGGVCAIQCKFYQDGTPVSQKDINSFLAASSREYFTSRLIIATTDKWGSNAIGISTNQNPPVHTIGLSDLLDAPIDWEQFDPDHPSKLVKIPPRDLYPHQQEALADVLKGFESYDQGKLIMACGTGKTFTSLRIAEEMVGRAGYVLFLVPSIALISQAFREWTREAKIPLQALAVCSDSDSTKIDKSSEDDKVIDLPLPATTNPAILAKRLEVAIGRAKQSDRGESMFVVFSTYQSLGQIELAQRDYNFPRFDLIICDEAHRTAGVGGTLTKDDSSFVLVHDRESIQGAKRLFMTATPKIYGERAKSKAYDEDIVLYSMDNEDYFGPEFHRLGFGEAVKKQLLSDYRVIILAVDEAYASTALHQVYADSKNELTLNDAAKLLGCWMGLAKISDSEDEFGTDTDPMKTGVIFVNKISSSKQIEQTFKQVVNEALAQGIGEQKNLPPVEIRHIDGTMGAKERNKHLNWLRETSSDLRLLTNARCLSEGVDVPSLDAIMFLQPRKSQIDVVQAVGRVMRKAPNKKFGYVILPVVIKSNINPAEALDKNKEFSIVWQVLEALKAHDERFKAIINTLAFGRSPDAKINVIGVSETSPESESNLRETFTQQIQERQGTLWPEQIEDAIYARIVERTSTDRFWPKWAEDVALLAATYVTRIKASIEKSERFRKKLDELVVSLQDNINPSITQDDAIEMLSQHMITKPVFDALFEGEQFALENPVSRALEAVVGYLQDVERADQERKSLDQFYESVRSRASAAKTREARQRLVRDLYENFFNTALKKTTDRMGIAYTPIEIVDFILHSVDELARQYFGVSLSDSSVHILDPFTGTGTFLVRLIELGLLGDNLDHKYRYELHANEIILLAYYIAAINIESAYHAEVASDKYVPFDGIVLTDTFQLNEFHDFMGERVFEANSKRIERQRKAPITVIVGNPPYSVGQANANDNAKNLSYPNLDARIRDTYAELADAKNKNSLYDSYIRALRWASDRIGDSGIVCFVTNGGWLLGNSGDGVRASLEQEFDAIYTLDLRGSIRRQYIGRSAKSEGGNVFNVMVPITIIALIRGIANDEAPRGIFYHDIGDYLSREAKLERLQQAESMHNVEWTKITPNQQHDWLGQRDNQSWPTLTPLAYNKKSGEKGLFVIESNGLVTNRDAWAYNSSREKLAQNIERTISFFNKELERYRKERPSDIDAFVDNNSTQISWSHDLKELLVRLGKQVGSELEFKRSDIRISLYRPFFTQWCYFNKQLNERHHQLPKLFPVAGSRNPAIIVTGRGAGVFTVLATNIIPDYGSMDKVHVFARYRFEIPSGKASDQNSLFGELTESSKPQRLDNITDEALESFQGIYEDRSLTKDDLFAYIYGVLNHPEYQKKYQNNLTKEYPRIPWLKDYRKLIDIGVELLQLHINYENIEPYPLSEEFTGHPVDDDTARYRATKMEHPSKGSGTSGKANWDRTRIVVNQYLRLSGIPEETSSWMLGSRPALELFLQRVKPSTDKRSGIVNDPNEFSEDPRYIVELTKRVVRVCVETVRLIGEMPEYKELQSITAN